MQIYQILNKQNNKSYISKTERTFRIRYGANWNKAVTNPYLKKSIKKYGQDGFKINILAECDNAEKLCELEKQFIKEKNSLYPNGYNFTEGGEGSLHIQDTKERISKTLYKFYSTKDKIDNRHILKCKVCNNEFKTYLSYGSKRVTCSRECFKKLGSINTTKQMKSKSIPIEAYDDEGNIIYKFNSIEQIKTKGMDPTGIRRIFKGITKMAYGLYWRKTL